MEERTVVKIPMLEVFNMLRKPNGLRGRQRVVALMYDHNFGDAFAFTTNATGGYGETITLHYETDEMLMRDLGFTEAESKSGKITTEPFGKGNRMLVIEYTDMKGKK